MITDYCTTIGIDVSDVKSKVCVMRRNGRNIEIVQETSINTTPEDLRRFLSTQDRTTPVTFETGTHCRWMHKVATSMGFKTYIANPCRLRMISESTRKNDEADARLLARMTLADVELLHPVKLRGDVYQKMVNLHEMRNLLVKQRTMIITQLRCFAKSMGCRFPYKRAESFHKINRHELPEELNNIIWPMFKSLENLSITIATYDKMIRELAETKEFKPMVDRLREIHYVGLYVATGFVAVTGGDMSKFERARDIGPWIGFTPRQDQSGEIDKHCHITKNGSELLRCLLTESANMILRDTAKATNLKLKGMRICKRGGKIAKRRAVTAVSRSLAVLMVAMLKKPDRPYEAISEESAKELERLYLN